jgi:hypothetical protein
MVTQTKDDPLSLLLDAAREDPQFLHDLVFNPKRAISKAAFLDKATKTRLLKGRSAALIAGIAGKFGDCGNSDTCSGSTCNGTCGSDTCSGVTCGGGSCDRTCENSCDDTISPPSIGALGLQLDRVKWKYTASAVKFRVTPPRR